MNCCYVSSTPGALDFLYIFRAAVVDVSAPVEMRLKRIISGECIHKPLVSCDARCFVSFFGFSFCFLCCCCCCYCREDKKTKQKNHRLIFEGESCVVPDWPSQQFSQKAIDDDDDERAAQHPHDRINEY